MMMALAGLSLSIKSPIVGLIVKYYLGGEK